MREVVLRLNMRNSWMTEIGRKYVKPVKLLDCMPHDGSGGKGLIEIDCQEQDIAELTDMIENHHNVDRIDVSPSPDGGFIASIICYNKCAGCKSLMGSNCFLISASSGEDGLVEWRLLVGTQESLSNLTDTLEENGCEVHLVKSKRIVKRMLTNRQKEIISIAFKEGYYDVPKKTTIHNLAQSFNVAQSTLAEIIQRGERKIIGEYLHRSPH